MGAIAIIKWQGRSGRKYKYWVYKIGTRFKEAPANYIFTRETAELTFAPIYISQTDDLSQQFDGHDKMPLIQQNGATHIHIHGNSRGEVARLEEEADLVSMWNTVCNS